MLSVGESPQNTIFHAGNPSFALGWCCECVQKANMDAADAQMLSQRYAYSRLAPNGSDGHRFPGTEARCFFRFRSSHLQENGKLPGEQKKTRACKHAHRSQMLVYIHETHALGSIRQHNATHVNIQTHTMLHIDYVGLLSRTHSGTFMFPFHRENV